MTLAEQLHALAALAEAGIVERRALVHMLRSAAQAAAQAAQPQAIDQTTVDLAMAAALCRQILSGRVRSLRWSAVEALAGTTLVLASRVTGREVQA